MYITPERPKKRKFEEEPPKVDSRKNRLIESGNINITRKKINFEELEADYVIDLSTNSFGYVVFIILII